MAEGKKVRVIPIKHRSVEIWHNEKGRLVFQQFNKDGTRGKEMSEAEALDIVKKNPRRLTILSDVQAKPAAGGKGGKGSTGPAGGGTPDPKAGATGGTEGATGGTPDPFAGAGGGT